MMHLSTGSSRDIASRRHSSTQLTPPPSAPPLGLGPLIGGVIAGAAGLVVMLTVAFAVYRMLFRRARNRATADLDVEVCRLSLVVVGRLVSLISDFDLSVYLFCHSSEHVKLHKVPYSSLPREIRAIP
jgi:hypothetical protein